MMGIGLDSGTIPVLKVLGLNPNGITNRQRITPLPIIIMKSIQSVSAYPTQHIMAVFSPVFMTIYMPFH